MKGKDPRDAHFITSRICGICGDNHATCSVYNQNMAYGVRPPHLGEWIINLGEAAEYMFDHNIFQENLVGVDYCEKMIAETNPGVLEQANRTEAPHARRARLQDHRRHHAGAQPVHRRVLPGGAAGQPLHPGDVLPDGGPPRAPLHALPGRRRHARDDPAVHRLLHPPHAVRGVHEARRADARRPVRLHVRGAARLRGGRPPPGAAGLLGRVQRPGPLRLPLPEHDQLGPQDVRHPRRGGGRQAGHQRPGRDQPGHPDPARPLVLPGLGGPGDLRRRTTRWATRSTGGTRGTSTRSRPRRSATSTTSTAGRCRRAGSTARTTSRWTPAAARSPGCGPTALAGLVDIEFVKATGHSVQINLPRTCCKPEASFEWKIPVDKQGKPLSNAIERNRARTYFQAYAAGVRAALHREGARRGARRATPRPGRSSSSRTRRSAAGSPRRCAACSATTW